MCVKEVPEYYKLVLNTLCMTNFVTSSFIFLVVGRVAQWLRRRSVAGGLSLIHG